MSSVSTQSRSKKIPWKWLVLGILILTLILAGRLLPLSEWLTQFDSWVKRLGPWGVVIYTLVYAVGAVLFLPGSLLTVGAGFVFGLVWGTVAVSLGATLGAALAFLIARYTARDKISVWARKNKKFEAIDAAIGAQGWKIVALLRLSPVIPFNVSNYLYGLTAVSFWPYLLASWVAMLPGTLLYVYLGVAGKTGLEAASGQGSSVHRLQMLFLLAGLLATLVVTWFVSRVARKALQKTLISKG